MMNTMTEKRHNMDRRSNSTASSNVGSTAGRPSAIISNRTADKSMSAMDWIAMTLLFVGGINWGLIGLFNFNLVAFIFGEMTTISRLVYVLVGLSALYSIYTASKMGRHT